MPVGIIWLVCVMRHLLFGFVYLYIVLLVGI